MLAGCAGVPTHTPQSDAQVQGSLQGDRAPVPPQHMAATPTALHRSGDLHGNVWDRIRTGFAMPDLQSPLVAEKERFYLSKPDYLKRMFGRGERYLFYIVEELDKRGMPTELALLPFVESAMNPRAVSPAKAAGLWQFIPSTGRQYELEQNWWVDNRRDPVKSTHAALDYLQKIYEMHGNDWFLALASYNWGENAVARAVKKNEARGRATDYLHLDMPAETRHYVPKLIALKNIILRSQELGLALPEIPNKPYFVTIEKTRPIDLKLAARFAGMSVDEFLALNPAHNRPVIAASRGHGIKLPAERVPEFLAAIDHHEQSRKALATWQPYTLQRGETISTVAHRAGLPPAELRQANGLKDSQNIVAGTRILAPNEDVADEASVEAFVAPRVYEEVERPAVYHTVGQKDSLGTIASRYGVSERMIAAWNGIKRGISRGMRLLVKPPASQTLLTDESGDRQVIASRERAPAMVPVSLPESPVRAASESNDASGQSGGHTATSAAPTHRTNTSAATRKATKKQQAAKPAASAASGTRRPDKRATLKHPEHASTDRRDGPA